MSDRDKIIDEKLASLKKQKDIFESKLAELPEYITNLRIGDDKASIVYNLRTVTSAKDYSVLLNAFSIINRMHKDIIDFSEFINEKFDRTICGYYWEDWQKDFNTLYSRIRLNDRLNLTNAAIKELETFYSNDKKDEIAFNKLLANIDKI